MKIGKEEILAILECLLFLAGASFLAIVFIDPANPMWALWVGLSLGAAGIVMWVLPNIFKGIKALMAKKDAPLPELPELQEDEADTKYELHRADAYDNYADKANEYDV